MGSLLKDCRTILSVCCAAMSGGYIVYVLYKSQLPNNTKCTRVNEESKSIPCLPEEIVIEILSYLTVKDLWRCKAVWKQWDTLVQDRSFTSKFMARKSKWYSQNSYCLNGQTVMKGFCTSLLTSCDGLDLKMEFVMRSLPYWMDLKYMWTSKLFITNAEAHQKLYIPKPHNETFGFRAYAFAFIPCIGEYKVVSVYSDNGKEKCAVLTLGGETEHHKWRALDIPESQNEENSQFLQVGTCLHCIAVNTYDYEITSLDMEKECFTVTNVPKDFIVHGKEQWIINWNESLAFVYIDEDKLYVLLLEDLKKLKWGDKFVVSLTFLKEKEKVEDDQNWGNKVLSACSSFLENEEEYVTNKLVPVKAMHGLLWFVWNNAHVAYDLESKEIVETVVPKGVGYKVKEGIFCHVPSVITLRGMQTVKQATPVYWNYLRCL